MIFNNQLISGGTIPAGSWQHIAFTKTGFTFNLYVNGFLKSSGNLGTTDQLFTAFHLGSLKGTMHYLNGEMDDVAVWNKVLTETEIQSISSVPLTGNESNLLACYNFNNGASADNNAGLTTLEDVSPNSNNGTLNNFTLTATTSNWVKSTVFTPSVSTQAVSSIATTTATGNGNITKLGIDNPTQYGVVWSKSTNPTVALTTKTAQGAIVATGAFTSSITGLESNTTYYVKAYATNTEGTSYGSEVSFRTLPVAPTVTTQAVSDIGLTTATGNGNVADLGVPFPTSYGICWNTAGSPTISDSKVDKGPISTTGAFTAVISGLTANTTYKARAYAINEAGARYGTEVSFTTTAAAPTVTGISPTSGPIAGGTTVTITGTNFTGATAVKFGSTNTAVFTVNSATQITATAPARSAGVVDITVSTAGGTSATSSADQFTYVAAPAATTNAATSISSTGATLAGIISAKNASTTVTFEYGLTTSYGTTVIADQSPVTGSAATPVRKAITGLAAGVTYHYRVVGVNAGGPTNGGDKSFTTPLFAGNGTPEDPYPIATLADLKWVSEHSDIWNGSFVQTADIDASTTSTWNASKGFSPIGDVTTKFTGSYNGQYHTITGLTINRPSGNDYNIGLFGVTSSATLKNIGLPDCSIIGGYNVGALVGYMGYNSIRTSSISDCYCTGEVSGISYVGGLVGVNQTSGITNSYSTCKVTALTDAAGLLALNINSTIANCFYDKNTSGQSDNIGKGTPKTTVEMKEQNTFTGWDFAGETANGTADIWAISSTQNNGYPCFKSQITSPIAPTVTTQAVTDIATTTATGNGDITGLGVPNPGSHGICWGTSANPTIIDNTVVNKGVVSATGAFSAPITGLTPNTLYHVRAYATNSTGTVYGNDVSFTTQSTSQTISFGALDTKTYGDASYNLTATSTSGLAISYSSDNTAVARVSGSTVTIVGAGTANITASQAGNATYAAAANVIQQLTINKKTLSVTAITDTKIYDGTTVSTAIPTVGTLATDDAINVAPAQVFDNANVGTTHVLTASGLTIKRVVRDNAPALDKTKYKIRIPNEDVTSNYDISYITATGTINKKAVTVTAVADTKTYDGSTASAVVPTVGTLASGDEINVAPAQTFDNAAVGTAHALTASGLTIKNGSADVTGNYDISYATATGTINKKEVTVTALADTKTYDGTTVSTAIPAVGTLATGDAINVAPAQVFDNATVGTTHVLTASGLTIKNGSADVTGNYDISYTTATGTINKLGVTVTAVADTKTYDGTTVSAAIPTVGTLATGDAINVAPMQVFDIAAVGTTHVLTASGLTIKNGSADVTGNYDISYASATGSITAKALTITIPAVTLSKVHDGNTLAAVTAGTLSGVVAGDAGKVTVAASASYDNATVGANKTITVTYTLGGSSAGNYSAPANYIATGAEIYSATIALQPLSDPTPNPTNTGLVLSYSVVTGGPTQYQITFETRAVSVGFQNVSYTALVTTGADGSISITVPKGTRPGKYKGTLKMRNDSGVESTAYDFVITVNIPTEYIAVKYNRVLVLDNSTRIFKAYQWFKNGVAIEGATKQFYRDPKGLVGTYSMQATDIDGEIIYSFPKELNIPIAQKVTAYPSLVRANQTCTVEITDESMELDLKGAELSVYSSQGIRVYHTTNVEKLNTVKLPAMDGTYSGRVTTTDGQSFLFKVIVAN